MDTKDLNEYQIDCPVLIGVKLNAEKNMSGFDEREKAQEAKFVHDAALKFKAEARRDKFLALWAAEIMGKTDVGAYINEVIYADLEEPGSEDVYRKVSADFAEAKKDISEEKLREKMSEFLRMAQEQVLTEV